MSGQESSKEAPISQAERAVIDYLRKNLRSDIMLIYNMVSESYSLAKNLQENWAREIEEDMASAYESCLAIKILYNKILANLVEVSGDEYWDRVFEIMQYLVMLQDSLMDILNKKGGDLDFIKNLSTLIKDNLEGLLLDMIEMINVGIANCFDKTKTKPTNLENATS